VVETNIHFPTDSTLLWDSVRTITRLVEDLHRKLPQGVEGFTNRTRSARRRMQEIERMSARERHEQQQPVSGGGGGSHFGGPTGTAPLKLSSGEWTPAGPNWFQRKRWGPGWRKSQPRRRWRGKVNA
jgi:hypothetical protein